MLTHPNVVYQFFCPKWHYVYFSLTKLSVRYKNSKNVTENYFLWNLKRSQDEAPMCSHGYFYRGNEKQTRTNLNNINVVLLRMSHSLKVPYTSRISYRVLNFVSSRGRVVEGRWPNFKPLGAALIRSGALIWSCALKILTHWDRGYSHITGKGMQEGQLELNP